MHLFHLSLLATRYLYDVCSSIIVICDLNFFRSDGPLVRLFVDDCAYPSSRLAFTETQNCEPYVRTYWPRSRSLGARFSTSHDLIADLSNVMSNLTPCWPISTVYPHYLVTGSLGVRRPEAYGTELPTLNRATKSLPYRRYAQWWAWLEGRRHRVDGFGKTVGHRKSDSIASSKKIRVANITCFGKIFPYTSYLFRETLRNKNLHRDGIAYWKSSEKGSEEVFLRMLIFIHIYLTLFFPYSFTLYSYKYFLFLFYITKSNKIVLYIREYHPNLDSIL